MSDDGPGTREVAHRLFAAEFEDASLSYSESDEEQAPNYVVTPTGARVNRLFVAGVLTEVERVNDETRRGRVVDPSAAFVTYAGQYQPNAQAFLERSDPPTFVALTGKARTFEPEDSDRVFTSVRPESLNEVDADTRDRWVVSAAEATLDRLAVFRRALASDQRGDALRTALETGGAPAALAAGIPRAIDHYDTSTAYVEAVRRLAVDALELIAGEREDVRTPDITPDAGGEASIGSLPETDVRIEGGDRDEADATSADSANSAGSADPTGPGTPESAAEATETESVASETGSVTPETEPTEPETPTAGGTTASERGDVDGDSGGGGLGDFDPDDGLPDVDEPDDSSADGDDTGAVSDAEPATDPGVTDEMYELDDEEREEIESEFGTDFTTGSEVDEPGEADIDVPDPDESAEAVETGDGTTGDAGSAGESGSSDPADPTVGETDVADGDVGAGGDGAVGEDGVVGDDGADDDDGGDDDGGPGDDGAVDDDSGAKPAAGGSDTGEVDVDLEDAVVETMASLDDGDGAERTAIVDTVASEYGVDPDGVEDAIRDALMSGKCYEPNDGVLKAI